MQQPTKHLNDTWALLRGIWAQESGAIATEYSALIGFIAVVIFAGVGLFGTSLNSLLSGLSSGIQTALGIP